jgi:hypothetical protein
MPRSVPTRSQQLLVMAAAGWSCVLLVLAVTAPFVTRDPAPVTRSIPSDTGVTRPTGAVNTYVTLAQAHGSGLHPWDS